MFIVRQMSWWGPGFSVQVFQKPEDVKKFLESQLYPTSGLLDGLEALRTHKGILRIFASPLNHVSITMEE